MPLPTYQQMMRPVLEVMGDGRERTHSEIREGVAMRMKISPEDQALSHPSGARILVNRCNWACIYLNKCGLLESVRRGLFKVTQRGLDAIKNPSETIDNRYLSRFEEYHCFTGRFGPRKNDKKGDSVIDFEVTDEGIEHTPDEMIDEQNSKLRAALADDLLAKIKSCSPRFFERLVVDVIVKMGYGGTLREAGQATQYSNDEGIDGIIKEDRLGLDVIYLQAKRWANPVGRPELQGFAGALQGQRANKGIFITTSTFTEGARTYCRNLESRIILIDGENLANYMIDFNVGVTVQKTIEIKRMDCDYFSEEE